MTEWTLLWGAVAVVASVLIARWYGRSWRALAEALAHQQRSGCRPAPEAGDAEAGARRGERVGAG